MAASVPATATVFYGEVGETEVVGEAEDVGEAEVVEEVGDVEGLVVGLGVPHGSSLGEPLGDGVPVGVGVGLVVSLGVGVAVGQPGVVLGLPEGVLDGVPEGVPEGVLAEGEGDPCCTVGWSMTLPGVADGEGVPGIRAEGLMPGCGVRLAEGDAEGAPYPPGRPPPMSGTVTAPPLRKCSYQDETVARYSWEWL